MPKIVEYRCTHCGRKFEAEEREVQECPGCFWSTSVKPNDDVIDPLIQNTLDPKKKPVVFLKKRSFWKGILKFGFGIILLFLITWGMMKALPWIRDMLAQLNSSQINTTALQKDILFDVSDMDSKSLSDDEKRRLESVITMPADFALTETDREILNRKQGLKTGRVENLPSAIWSLEQFNHLLDEQQTFYKVPLPRSYRKKLESLFLETYSVSQEAYQAGNLIEARNLWVESLAFPIYADELQKHRGVALTMLRPFINDTLAKIGVVNNLFAERKIREKEERINQLYESLFPMMANREWQRALDQIAVIEENIQILDKSKPVDFMIPPYPPSIQQLDPGIQSALVDLLNTQPPTVADVKELQNDLHAKKTVLENLIPERREQMQSIYNEAIQHIEAKEWENAIAKLRKVSFPDMLVEDARTKMRIIEKIKKAELDSEIKTG